MYEVVLYDTTIKTMYGKKEIKLVKCTATGMFTLTSGNRFRFVAKKNEMQRALSGLYNSMIKENEK